MIDIEELKKEYEKIQNLNQNTSHIILDGTSKLFLSAPHASNQTRNGQIKLSEAETAYVCLYLNKYYNIPCIIKLHNKNDDANFDEICEYKQDLTKIFQANKPSLFVDLHEMKYNRFEDVCLGTGDDNNSNLLNLSSHICNIINCFNFYKVVEINIPFKASFIGTNAKFVSSNLNIPSLQIEVSSRHVWDYRGATAKTFENFINCLLKLNDYVNNI